jgi:predicted nucleotide-binding protein
VLDWRTDFKPGSNILQQIEQAAARCGSGIFLFTKDDDHVNASSGGYAAPRDNVVFEAGYFISAKGKERVLILREQGAKMPADLGGDIYGSFEDRPKLDSITDTLRRFIDV